VAAKGLSLLSTRPGEKATPFTRARLKCSLIEDFNALLENHIKSTSTFQQKAEAIFSEDSRIRAEIVIEGLEVLWD